MDEQVPLITRLLSRAETLAHLSQSNDAALMREAVEELERRGKGWSEAFNLGHYHQTAHYAKRDALEAIDTILTEEINVRFSSLPERERTRSSVYNLLVVPRNMARAALQAGSATAREAQ